MPIFVAGLIALAVLRWMARALPLNSAFTRKTRPEARPRRARPIPPLAYPAGASPLRAPVAAGGSSNRQ
jgi:phosphatidylserine decarboxylase